MKIFFKILHKTSIPFAFHLAPFIISYLLPLPLRIPKIKETKQTQEERINP